MATSFGDSIELTGEQRLVQRSVSEVCDECGREYWRACAAEGEYPREFVATLSEAGWLGASIPEEYGGAGTGTSETVVMMEEIARSGGGFSVAQAVNVGIYNPLPLVKYGSEELKAELLPAVGEGEASIQAFGLTEPNATGTSSTTATTRSLTSSTSPRR